MANEKKRITQLPTAPQVEDNDYIALDNTSTPSAENDGGSRKILAKDVMAKSADAVDYDNTSSGLEADNVQDAIDEVLEEGGKVQDVKVNGVSVLDNNKTAQIVSYKEVTQAEYDALPSSKLTDGIMYCIKDAEFSASDVPYDNSDSGLESEDVQSAVDEVVGEIEDIQADVDNKADVDGMYEELFAGNLLSDSYTADNAPYLYRQSPSASSVEQNIVGGTVAWNQIYNYTVDGESLGVRVLSQNGVVTISGTTTGTGSGRPLAWTDFKSVIGHKYIYLIDFQMPNNSYIMDQYNISTTVNAIGRVFNASFSSLIPQLRYDASGVVFDISNKHLSIIDLTQALGSTIADYLYTIDQANAGAGLAKLQEWGFCTKSYYAYNAGTLMSVKTSGRKIVRKNLLNANTSYNVVANTTWINTPCDLPKGTYTFNYKPSSADGQITFNVYNEQDERIYNNPSITNSSHEVTFTINERASRIGSYSNSALTISEIQIEKGSTATTYEPYTSTTYPLDSDLTLRGIPKLDSNNNLYYDGDIYQSDGSVTRKYGSYTFTGNESWTQIGTDNVYYSEISGVSNLIKKPATGSVKCGMVAIVEELTYGEMNSVGETIEGIGAIYSNGRIVITKKLYDNKSKLTGTELAFPLTTSTSETADAYENPQLVGSTEEFIDTRDVPMPVGGDRKYYTDLKAKLEELAKIPDVPSTNGTYTLKATRSASGVEYSWVSG